ncbi:hypothetical protein TNCV_1950481 [Trichonephila clavipes]|nr:hypothetical protein TNCV_1950481 [Trichonephila clavipes]
MDALPAETLWAEGCTTPRDRTILWDLQGRKRLRAGVSYSSNKEVSWEVPQWAEVSDAQLITRPFANRYYEDYTMSCVSLNPTEHHLFHFFFECTQRCKERERVAF